MTVTSQISVHDYTLLPNISQAFLSLISVQKQKNNHNILHKTYIYAVILNYICIKNFNRLEKTINNDVKTTKQEKLRAHDTPKLNSTQFRCLERARINSYFNPNQARDNSYCHSEVCRLYEKPGDKMRQAIESIRSPTKIQRFIFSRSRR